MKIGILTHYQVHNHGAILQMHGLYNTLKILGHIPYILTYNKNFDFIEKELSNKYNISLKSIPFYLKYLKQQGIAKTKFNIEKHKILNNFKESNYNFLPLYPNQQELDAVCIGSDEVWSLEAGVNIMMYSHTITTPLIFAYAPVFGQTNIEEIKKHGCYEIIKSGLERFNFLSARDLSSAQTIKQILNKEIPILCDPVLLYGYKEEQNLPCNKIPKEKYLLVYAYDNRLNDKKEYENIIKYAKENNLKIISPGFYHNWVDENINVTPIELINIFKKAQCVVTDTFHGSVLSILTNKPFACFVRNSNTNKINFLLNQFNASQAKLDNWDDLNNTLTQNFDWSKVNSLIEQERQTAMQYLGKVVNNE
ncbi:polysaccharide pyruvyl transferase family protein [Candidatus Ruminimicrobium bovinum]|uniref:polysaccharide pyruvyl transferase family protein n=1 Tax=Candidatus Ruminimicrobium bovinum TaxID=3242779 RepID=UPI0039B99DFE